jgi:hypothetical protein
MGGVTAVLCSTPGKKAALERFQRLEKLRASASDAQEDCEASGKSNRARMERWRRNRRWRGVHDGGDGRKRRRERRRLGEIRTRARQERATAAAWACHREAAACRAHVKQRNQARRPSGVSKQAGRVPRLLFTPDRPSSCPIFS